MFRNWGFLLGEIWVLLLLAALVGLLAGWLIWGGRRAEVSHDSAAGDEVARLRAALGGCEQARGDAAQRIAALEAELAEAEARAAAAAARAGAAEDRLAAAPPAPAAATAVVPVADVPPAPAVVEMVRPATLDAARSGGPDNLKLIKGIGPKMEELCNRLGFYHFDQIAAWTPAELAWVDDNLEGFKGRATRDNWIGQARDLAAGKPPLPGGEH